MTPTGVMCEAVDLSAVGMRVRSMVELALDSQFEGILVLEDGRRVPVQGTVVWRAPSQVPGFTASEIGIELDDPSEAYLNVVASLFAASA